MLVTSQSGIVARHVLRYGGYVAQNRKAISLLILTVVVFLAIFTVIDGGPAELAVFQFIAFPLITAIFSFLSIGTTRIPRAISGFACVAALCGAVFTYTHVDLAQGAFIVAPFAGDELEADTKIARDRIRRFVGPSAVSRVGVHSYAVDSATDAEALLHDGGRLGGVVWGSKRWINISLRLRHPIQMGAVPSQGALTDLKAAQMLKGLNVVTSVRSIGVSDGGDLTTLQFVAGIVSVWGSFDDVLLGAVEDPDYEAKLRSIAALKTRWTSYSHRALPMWMTGTYHLTRALIGAEASGGELACALRAFEAAHAQLRPGDNPELEIAIINNQAVAYMVKAAMGMHRKASRQMAIALLSRAKRAAKLLPHDPGRHAALYDTVALNMSLIKKRKHGARKTDP